jgi:hypothetical protein
MLSVVNPRGASRSRKMTAKQAKYFGKRRKSHSRRKSYSRRRKTYRRNPRTAVARSHSRRSSRRSYSRRAVARGRSYFRKARSRLGRVGGFAEKYGLNVFIPAAVGGIGALALDLAWGYLPIPSALQTGMLAPLARLAGAVSIGIAAGMIAGKKFGREVTAGATVVTVYDLVKGWLKTNYPSLPLSMYLSRYNPGMVIGPARARLGMYLSEYAPDYVNEFTQDESGIINYP